MRRLGCRGAAAGLLSALPRHSSCSLVPIPMPFSSPISIPGAVLENFSLVLVSKAALELAPLPSPGFYSLLFVVLLTSGSWRSVITLSHLLLFVDVSHFQLGSIQSMLLSVSQGDCWPPSISGKRTFQCRFILLLVPFFASCSVTRSTSSRLCALASPRLRRSSPGSWLLFQLYSILWVSVCVDTSTTGWSSLPQESLLEVLLPVLRLCHDCRPSQVFQPRTFPGSAVSVGRHRFHLFQGFSVGGTHLTAAIYSRRISVLRLAYREPVAVASRRSFLASSPSSGWLAFFLSWLASFLVANWDCGPSSSASIVHGTVRIWELQS